MRHLPIFLCLGVFLAGQPLRPCLAEPEAAATLELTLENAIDLALKQNLDVELAELNLKTFQSYYRQAIAAAIPDISLSGSYLRNFKKPSVFFGPQKIEVGSRNSMRHAAAIEQTLYSGGMVHSGIKAARTGINAGQEELKAARSDVTLAVRRLFYAVFLASETVIIQADNLASAEDHLKTIEERYRQGLDSDLILLRQKVEVANARPALIQARNNYELSNLLLKDTLGMDVDTPIRLSGGLQSPQNPIPAYEKLRPQALANNPDYQASLQSAQRASALVQVAKGIGRPQLSLYADYQWYSESDDMGPGPNERATSSAGGFRLRYPFFTGGDLLERVRQAKLDKEKALTLSDKIKRSVRMELKRHWLSVQEAAERSSSQQSAISQARRALEATEIRFRQGESSQLELTDATLALQRARLLHAQALHDYGVEFAGLERAVGTPLEETAR